MNKGKNTEKKNRLSVNYDITSDSPIYMLLESQKQWKFEGRECWNWKKEVLEETMDRSFPSLIKKKIQAWIQ